MRISVVVCTYNRADRLGPCLDALRALEFDAPWELVLVDNGSRDDTASVLEAFKQSTPLNIRIVRELTPGLAAARNAGVAAAAGDIIAFTDDDCYPRRDFLRAVSDAFDRSEIGYAGGRIMLYDPADYPVTILESTVPQAFPARAFMRAGAVQGACMAFRKAALEDIGGFDPLFGSGALFPAEDIDAVGRASWRGWAGCYDPEIVVYHHHGRKAADVPALMRAYNFGRGAYHMKLLLVSGAWRWFLAGNASLLKKGLRDPVGFLQELNGQFRYIMSRHQMLSSRGR